jgi:nucleotide-binding universal stress UspA family protein
VSSRADLFGVGFSVGQRERDDRRGQPLRLRGMEMIASTRHVSAFTLPAFQWEPVYNLPDIAQSRQAELRSKLESFLASELQAFPAINLLVEGDPSTEIAALAHREKTDLIVMPTHGYGPFRRFLLGSVTAKVLHDVECAVWTGVHMQEALVPENLSYRKVVCAVDLGPQTRAALRWAAGFAAAWKADLAVIHAMPSVESASETGWPGRFREVAQEQIAEHLDALGTKAEVYIESGGLPDSVSLCVSRLAADLLVIGRGHGSSGGGRLPTHAYTIIRESPCPVVSV